MLKILGHRNSSNVQKVLWCCAELGLPFEREDKGGPFGGTRTPEYLALNPHGLIPTVIDDGLVLWESNTIVRYLAARYGDGRLLPADPGERALSERWMDWQLGTLGASMAPLFWILVRTPEEQRDPARIAELAEKAGEAFALVDRQLGRSDFVAGPELTVGDLPIGVQAHRWYSFSIRRPELANLAAWYARLCHRPGFQKHVMIALT